ncbi:MAG: energy-coupling factor transporter transmembrane component T, partial [Candidatus Marinimicrobia bacterium]|nr:energy-coupling factor transporter transmembrane component T [Candidatus Neomarinimicrobiota bacterium]
LPQPLLLAMRYSLLIRKEFRSLQQVHRIMGIARPKRLIARVKYYVSLVFPTIVASLERAEHLSIAMTSRGYNKEIL